MGFRSKSLRLIALIALLAWSSATASDPSQLQDFCVTDKNATVFVNGVACKDHEMVTADDFFFTGLDKAGNTTNIVGSKVTSVNVAQLPGLNTLGISLVRIDYASGGLNPPHTHPRGTEVLVVLDGTLFVGFVTSNPDNKLFTKVLNKGDVFVFPQSLIHFQLNNGITNAVAIAGLSSQNPSVITVANAVFASKLLIADDVLTKAFQVSKEIIHQIEAKFS